MKIKLFEEYSDNSNNQYYEKIGIKGWEKLTEIDSSPFIHYRCDQFDGLVKLLKDKNYL